MEAYKYGDIKISVSCEMERDEEMKAALQYMMAAKERLETTKQILNPRIDAVGEARLVVILQQLRGLVEVMKQGGIDATLVAPCGAFESVRLNNFGRFIWYPDNGGSAESCDINNPLEMIKAAGTRSASTKVCVMCC